ncbi:DUF986 family protein [Sporolactobacillus vineae]|uniref:DUF986 family protein n=1 Tax=Sporolactobacillus vineae TaxID=444463 RepID=UPI000289013A|nr:DUF986 family protein [Sporolactobacillus vineae]
MTVTDIILLLIVIAYSGYYLFDGLIQPFLGGKTVLTVRLRRRNYADQLIFAGIVVIIFINNRVHGGGGLTDLFLLLLTMVLLYGVIFYAPKARFKEKGFYYGLSYNAYAGIKKMKLSKDGVLVIECEKRRVLLFVRQEEDLEKILKMFVAHE